MSYYPPDGSAYPVHQQPVVYTSSNAGYNAGYAPGAYLGQPEAPPVVIVPSQGSHHSHRSRSRSHHGHHHHHSSSHAPTVMAAPAPVVMQQPVYPGGYTGYGQPYYELSFGERMRRFFGLAPRGPFKYRTNYGTWGFMGYSKRQRYSDARTGAEVDRKGRPIYRV
ncbi:hypothetical protein H0H92_010504 [Tricholoma furcatifolium]|nr:hypothetical protein H0H92_010504 [Tricholoma furcatifolium]